MDMRRRLLRLHSPTNQASPFPARRSTLARPSPGEAGPARWGKPTGQESRPTVQRSLVPGKRDLPDGSAPLDRLHLFVRHLRISEMNSVEKGCWARG